MSHGLQVFDEQGRLTFDSRTAVGGVCLGIYNVTTNNVDLAFPDMGPGLTGLAFNAVGDGVYYTYDNDLGYPRFRFSVASGIVILFVK